MTDTDRARRALNDYARAMSGRPAAPTKTPAVNETRLLLSAFLLLFVGLKIAGVIDWSWWWVLSPIWIHAALTAVIVAALFAFAAARRG